MSGSVLINLKLLTSVDGDDFGIWIVEREYFVGIFSGSGHVLGSALTHSDGVAEASAGYKGPLAGLLFQPEAGAAYSGAGRINGKAEILCSQIIALAGSSSELD